MDRRKQRIDDLAASTARPRDGSGTASGAVLVVDDAGTVDEAPGVSLIASAWRRLRRDPVFLVGAVITLVFVVLAIISPWIAPHDPAVGCCSTRCARSPTRSRAPSPASRSAPTTRAATCSRA